MKPIDGGVTSAKGYQAASAAAGIKYKDRTDMALVYSERDAVCAGTYTTNVVKAAPVKWDSKITGDGKTVHAVVLNSGIANACTGEQGMSMNRYMAETIAGELGILPEEVLTASTGVIGMQLAKEPLKHGATLLKKNLADTREAAKAAAEAIMTTDTVSKEAAVQFETDGKTVTIGGMCKGSGMIHPNMATMLSVAATDAVISHEDLQEMLGKIVPDTFNMISVDRDTSTNDTYLVLANGASGAVIEKGTKAYDDFYDALLYVSTELAKKMAADGEGCTRLFETRVIHCETKEKAKILARSVISSNLVKTMIYGSDANCGRVMCALGYSGVSFNPEVIDMTVSSKEGEIVLVKDGVVLVFDEELAKKILSADAVVIECDMKEGTEEATAWGCDLTYEYVKINGDYRS